MHYLQLFITRHKDECYDDSDLDYITDQAEGIIDEFLGPYEYQCWDWYVMGGRWANLFGGRVTVPYKEALPELKEMLDDYNRKLEEEKPRVLEAINGTSKDEFMDGFYVKRYGELLGKHYTDEPLFYDVEYGQAFRLLTEEEANSGEYYVTIVDIHN